MPRKSSAKGAERKTPHVQRSPYRRVVTALRHQVRVFEAAAEGGGSKVEWYRGYLAGLKMAIEIVDLVFFSDHSGRRGKDGV